MELVDLIHIISNSNLLYMENNVIVSEGTNLGYLVSLNYRIERAI